MPKEFYTERDIEDMARRGVTTLELNDNVVLTELAYEKANRLGIRLLQNKPENPPSAPVRPYVAQNPPASQIMGRAPSAPAPVARSAAPSPAPAPAAPQPAAASPDLHQRIRQAVLARMGSQVDSNLLDAIIKRVLANTGVK